MTYLLADFSENALYARMLSDPAAITDSAVYVQIWATRIKWASVILASVQAALVFATSFSRA